MEEENSELNETFEVRDLRAKERFVLDNEFFNGYVRILGTNALGVYCSLARHANKMQKCYPSQKKIAEELSLSRATVNEWIKVLEYFKIIKKQRIGKGCTNRYWLLDKKKWRKDWQVMSNELTTNKVSDVKPFDIQSQTILLQESNHLTSNSKETQKKGNTIVTISNASVAEKDINSKIELFKPLNPLTYKKWYSNKTQRAAIGRLMEALGDKLELAINTAILANGKKYAPTITAPLQLEEKLSALRAWVIKEKSNLPTIAKIR